MKRLLSLTLARYRRAADGVTRRLSVKRTNLPPHELEPMPERAPCGLLRILVDHRRVAASQAKSDAGTATRLNRFTWERGTPVADAVCAMEQSCPSAGKGGRW